MTVSFVSCKLNEESLKEVKIDPKIFNLKEVFLEVIKHLEADYAAAFRTILTNKNWTNYQEYILNDLNLFFSDSAKCRKFKPALYQSEFWRLQCLSALRLCSNKEIVFSLEDKLILVQPLTDDAQGYNRYCFRFLDMHTKEENYIPIHYQNGEVTQYFPESTSIIKSGNLLVIHCAHLGTKWPEYQSTGASNQPSLSISKLLVLQFRNGCFHQIHGEILSSLTFDTIERNENGEIGALTEGNKFYRFKKDGTFSVCELANPQKEQAKIEAFRGEKLIFQCLKESKYAVSMYDLTTHKFCQLATTRDPKYIKAKINLNHDFIVDKDDLILFNKDGISKDKVDLKLTERFLSISHEKIIIRELNNIKVLNLKSHKVSFIFENYSNFYEFDWKWKKYIVIQNNLTKKFEFWDLSQMKKVTEMTAKPIKFECEEDHVQLICLGDEIEVWDFKR